MDTADDDRSAVSRNLRSFRRRSLAVSLLLMPAVVFGSHVAEHRLRLPHEAAQALVLLPVSLLAYLGYTRMWNSTALELSRRQRVMRAERIDNRFSRFYPWLILMLAVTLALNVHALIAHHPLPPGQTAFNMVSVIVGALLPWRPGLLGRSGGASDEVATAEYRRAAVQGLLTTVVLLLLALVYEAAAPGTLAMSVPPCLVAGALVLWCSLWWQNRVALRGE